METVFSKAKQIDDGFVWAFPHFVSISEIYLLISLRGWSACHVSYVRRLGSNWCFCSSVKKKKLVQVSIMYESEHKYSLRTCFQCAITLYVKEAVDLRHKLWGAFHSTKNSEISSLKLNGTVKIPGKVFENLGIRFECTLFDRISGIIENFVFHSQEMSGLLPSKRIVVFVFLAKLRAAQMNCQLESAQCTLLVVSWCTGTQRE